MLCSLCVCHGVAVRSNQHLICDNLLPGRDLLLQTRLINHVSRYTHTQMNGIFVVITALTTCYDQYSHSIHSASLSSSSECLVLFGLSKVILKYKSIWGWAVPRFKYRFLLLLFPTACVLTSSLVSATAPLSTGSGTTS